MWNTIAPYVYEQLVSAIVTLLIIDRLLAWREKKKWLAVRELFLVHADRAISQNINVWSNWLENVIKEAPELELGDDYKKFVQQRFGIPRASKGAIDSLKEELSGMSEPRMGFPFSPKVVENWRIHLTVYLTRKGFAEGHPSWERLRNDLSGSVQKLMELVDKFSALVEPEAALPILRLALELDLLSTREHEMESNSDGLRISTAERLASAVAWALKLKIYVIKNRRNMNWEYLDSVTSG